jgi:7-cyano-7-deazaguanine reductase
MGARKLTTNLKHLGILTGHEYSGAKFELLDRVPVPQSKTAATLTVTITGEEFTSLCPATGGPDFGKLNIVYRPREWMVESKSLKLYLETYRQERDFHEACISRICDHLVMLLDPNFIVVEGVFNPRGGWAICPTVEWHRTPDIS